MLTFKGRKWGMVGYPKVKDIVKAVKPVSLSSWTTDILFVKRKRL